MNIYKHEKSRYYWCRFQHNNQQIRKSTHTADYDEALLWAQALREKMRAEYKAERGTLVEIAELDYRRIIQLDLDESRLATLRNHWSHLHRHLGRTTSCVDIPESVLDDYVVSRRDEGISTGTIRREISTLLRGLKLGKRRGIVDDIPLPPEMGRHVKGDARTGREHPISVLRCWMDYLHGEWHTLALVALLTGLRREELARLTMNWVHDAGGLLVPSRGAKTRRPRWVGLPVPALAALQELARKRCITDVEPVFASTDYRSAWAAARKAIGYNTPISLRDLRTTHASLAGHLCGDPAAVQAQLGHVDLATTALYMRSTRDRQRASAQSVAGALYSADPTLYGRDDDDVHDGPEDGLEVVPSVPEKYTVESVRERPVPRPVYVAPAEGVGDYRRLWAAARRAAIERDSYASDGFRD